MVDFAWAPQAVVLEGCMMRENFIDAHNEERRSFFAALFTAGDCRPPAAHGGDKSAVR